MLGRNFHDHTYPCFAGSAKLDLLHSINARVRRYFSVAEIAIYATQIKFVEIHNGLCTWTKSE